MSVDCSSEMVVPNEKEKAKIEEVRKLIGPAASKFPHECSDESILRYLRAKNGNTKRAAKMLKRTLKWRMEFKPEKIQWDDVVHEATTGKVYRANFDDKHGRPVLVMRPGLQNPNPVDEQIKCFVYCLENAIANLKKGQEQMVWLIDFDKWNMACISVRVTRETARILQEHYPERLGLALLYNPPKVFESFWSLVKPFLEPKTYKKVKFVYSNQPQSMKTMERLFDMDKLETSFGGRGSETFNFEAYARRMKDEERQKFDAKNQPSSQMSPASESDFLLSDVGSEISDGTDTSCQQETVVDLEGLEETERSRIRGKDNKIDCKRMTNRKCDQGK